MDMEVRTWHMWEKTKGTTDERFRVMAGAGGKLSSPPPPNVRRNDRGRRGCQSSRLKRRGERGRR